MLTYLAIGFVILLIGIIFYGFSIVMRRPPTAEELHSERCSICRERFPLEHLIERAVGDAKILYFCRNCITNLHEELIKGAMLPTSSETSS